jgi:hypothetical protein
MGEALWMVCMIQEGKDAKRAKAAKAPASTFVASDKMTQTPSVESKGEAKIGVDVYDTWFADAQIWYW